MVSLKRVSSLTWDISSQEIKKALFSFGDDKLLGLDSYTLFFFKKSWGTSKVILWELPKNSSHQDLFLTITWSLLRHRCLDTYLPLEIIDLFLVEMYSTK